jgi:subtilisin family serine protease
MTVSPQIPRWIIALQAEVKEQLSLSLTQEFMENIQNSRPQMGPRSVLGNISSCDPHHYLTQFPLLTPLLPQILGAYSVFSSSRDGRGHGTHVAGTVAGSTYGVAKDATLFSVKVLDDSGSGSVSGLVSAMSWVGQQCSPSRSDSTHPGLGWFRAPSGAYMRCVATMSLGGGYSQSLNDAVATLVRAGNIPVIVAAGDAGTDASRTSPASAPDAVTVKHTKHSDLLLYLLYAMFTRILSCNCTSAADNVILIKAIPLNISAETINIPIAELLLSSRWGELLDLLNDCSTHLSCAHLV